MLRSVEWIEKRDFLESVEPVRVTANFINDEWHFYEKEIWDVRTFPVPTTPSLLNNLAIVQSCIKQCEQPLTKPILLIPLHSTGKTLI
ncbi:MAG: hypothetical protein A3E37_01500 [Candidatus Andersenbacteria bacterium RIFCSPHIGHO2_12_FULL_46_9]|nr:MAG: hypothetical protein UW94_C0020G0019 [Parcubacteria group bacterium GW2011_GWA2_45_14]OGY35810.1 MAG: hypothetical protein A3E37_01500 [Candidatus Andersenbacteria bacterium RIFCSPHIGHO2_12_FULL_46_9]OGY35954.1 MAG: hypothetical protein A3B76_04235 [Candidatus Andersenbacteria bacterium RIFCSPHIGHO2_02_FULL_46_16]OGY37643.1 MAG: hypothetical protein A3I08_01100 [Candidatus Andersenbacteria bacterium RIFCSPLOWO2_02_FULL_46_11]OGY38998.1 MAG: hypothetical protein A3G57_03745 [Candidatus A